MTDPASTGLPKRWVWLLVCLAVGLHASYLIGLAGNRLALWPFDSHQFIEGRGADFYVLPEAGWDFLHGENMYVHDNATRREPYPLTFRYVPFFGYTLGVVLALIPPPANYFFWIAVNELLLIANLLLTWRRAPTSWARVGAVWIWLAPFPIFLEQWLGQFSILMGSLLFWTALSLVERPRSWAADVAWTGSSLLKNYSILMVPLWIRLRRWRGIALCIGMLIVTSVPYFLIYPEGWALFREHGTSGRLAVGSYGYDRAGEDGLPMLYWGCQGLQTALQALVNAAGLGWTEIAGIPIGLLFIAAVSGLLIALPLVLTLRRDTDTIALFCLWSMSFFILYRDFWEHHYVLLLPVLALAMLYLKIPWQGLVVAGALIAFPTPWRVIGFPRGHALLEAWGLVETTRICYFLIKPAGGILLYGLLLDAASKSVPILAQERPANKIGGDA
ncbi:MAG: glycosyltransferase 87 family protein [bacterium]